MLPPCLGCQLIRLVPEWEQKEGEGSCGVEDEALSTCTWGSGPVGDQLGCLGVTGLCTPGTLSRMDRARKEAKGSPPCLELPAGGRYLGLCFSATEGWYRVFGGVPL